MAGINIKIVQNIKAGTRSIVADTLSFDKEKLFVCVPLMLDNRSLYSHNVYPNIHTEIGYYIHIIVLFFIFYF